MTTSNATTRKMLRLFEQAPKQPAAHFSGMFQAPPENFYNTEEVEIDIERSEEDVAIVVHDMSVDANFNSTGIYDNKEFKPPIFKEGFVVDSFKLMQRQPGQDPFQDPSYVANAVRQFQRGMSKIENKIRRSIELQASQVMQTGEVSLVDAAGDAQYTIDFKPKAAHFPQVTTSWGAANDTPLADIASLAEVIRNNGLSDPDILDMGATAFENAMKNSDWVARFETRRADLGRLVPPERMGNGGTYRGVITIGNYSFDIYTYGGRYKHPATGTKTPYLTATNVVVRVSDARMDATFGNIPRIIPPSNRVSRFIPQRIRRTGRGGVDLITNVWTNPSGEQLLGSVSARPLLIPTAIDTFGCLNTVAAA